MTRQQQRTNLYPTNCSFLLFLIYSNFFLALCHSTTLINDSNPCRLNSSLNQDQNTQDKIQTILLQIQSKQQQQQQQQKIHRYRPFVTLSYAQTLNGMIAIQSPSSSESSSNLAISCPESFQLTHAIRSVHDAILIGKQTMAVDNPRLNVRLWPPPSQLSDAHEIQQNHQPKPVVLDTDLTWLLQHDTQNKKTYLPHIRAKNVIVCCSPKAYQKFKFTTISSDSFSINYLNYNKTDICTLQITRNVENNNEDNQQTITLISCQTYQNVNVQRLDLNHVLRQLYEKCQIKSIMVEGGSSTLSSFMKQSIMDCICVTIAPSVIGSDDGGLNAFGDIQTSESHENSMIALEIIDYWKIGTDCIMLAEPKLKH